MVANPPLLPHVRPFLERAIAEPGEILTKR
jgi:hypothetical protein